MCIVAATVSGKCNGFVFNFKSKSIVFLIIRDESESDPRNTLSPVFNFDANYLSSLYEQMVLTGLDGSRHLAQELLLAT